MNNRKITVKVGNHFSDFHPLYNGIPQGSPLSVIIFLIAYNKLCSIIRFHKEVQFCDYADDFNLIVKHKKDINPTSNLNHLFQDILNWCEYSGAKLSPTKCKYIHICRKQNCNCNILTSDILLSHSDELKILGIIVNKKYKWNSHIDYLTSSLTKQLNVIKCLSSPKLNCNTYSLVTTIKSLIISKISYGLFLFGYSPKSHLNKLKVIIHAAIRSALGALRSTPINNLLLEADILPIEILRDL